MSSRISALLACAGIMVFCAAQPARAQSPWYVEGSAGAFWRMDASHATTITNVVTGVSGPATNTITYDPGPTIFLGLGYKLPSGFRIDGQLGYAHYASATASPLSLNGLLPRLNGQELSLQSGGGHSQYSAWIDAFYDLPFAGRAVPYIGGGVGAVHTQAQQAFFTGPNVGFTQGASNTTYAAIAAEVGLTFVLDPTWSVVPAYRFQHVFTPDNAFPGEVNIFKLGFRHSL
jgi:opacity protein-like surface antigen